MSYPGSSTGKDGGSNQKVLIFELILNKGPEKIKLALLEGDWRGYFDGVNRWKGSLLEN